MYATQKNQLRRLSQQEFIALSALCRLSKNLFNLALYESRQYFFAQRKRLSYESNYHLCKQNENYRWLNTDIAQQTMKVVVIFIVGDKILSITCLSTLWRLLPR